MKIAFMVPTRGLHDYFLRYRDGVWDKVAFSSEGYEDLVHAVGVPCDQDWADRERKMNICNSHDDVKNFFGISQDDCSATYLFGGDKKKSFFVPFTEVPPYNPVPKAPKG